MTTRRKLDPDPYRRAGVHMIDIDAPPAPRRQRSPVQQWLLGWLAGLGLVIAAVMLLLGLVTESPGVLIGSSATFGLGWSALLVFLAVGALRDR